MPPPSPPRRYHLVSDAELQSFYEARVGSAGPAFSTLNTAQRAEFRLFVETRGVLWNPRWGLVGRLNAYEAFRNFTLTEAEDPRIQAIIAKAEKEEEADPEADIRRRQAAKIAGKGPRRAGGVARDPAEEEARAKIGALQKAWAALGEAIETKPGDPNVPGSYRVKKKTGENTWDWPIVYPLNPRKEKILEQIVEILRPIVHAQVAQKLKQLPPEVAARIDPGEVGDTLLVKWGNDVRLVEKKIADGKYPADGSLIAGTFKTPGARREEEYFQRYVDAPADRSYNNIVQDVTSYIQGEIGNEINRLRRDPTFGSPEVDVTGERGEEGEEKKITPVADDEEAEEGEEDPEELRQARGPILRRIQKELTDADKEVGALFGIMIGGTRDEEAAARKLGWDRAKFAKVRGKLQALMRPYIKNPRTRAALVHMRENRQYHSFLQMAFPGLFIPVPDATYSTYRKFSSI